MARQSCHDECMELRREALILQGRLRYQLHYQGFRCPFSQKTLDLRSAVLLDGSRTPERAMVALHTDAWDAANHFWLYVTGWAEARVLDGRDASRLFVIGETGLGELGQEPGPYHVWSAVGA
jgi:hypothetical protein